MESNPATEAAESELRPTGQRWKIRVAEDPPQRVSILENHILGLGGRGRVAVVDASGLLWETVSRDVGGAPAWAAFVLADGIGPAIDLKPADRRRWLTSLARAAVLESSGDSA
jgi:hypothetical protein